MFEPHEVNGQPGAIFRDRDGQIQVIGSVLNPDKLAHLGPAADAWAVNREANLAHRPGE